MLPGSLLPGSLLVKSPIRQGAVGIAALVKSSVIGSPLVEASIVTSIPKTSIPKTPIVTPILETAILKAAAAAGFARALALAPAAPDADETRLMLAVIHVRKAPDPAQARAALDAIGPALPEAMRPLAAALREELAGTLRGERGT